MASVDGRSTWFAWLVGLVCAVIVGALVWLAAPMGPAVAEWAGSALRGELNPPRATTAAESGEQDGASAVTPDAPAAAPGAPAACRDLYDTVVWDALQAAPGAALSQGIDYPPSAMAGLPEALGARMALSCTWTADADAAIITTVADVSDSAASLAEAALTARGFACAPLAGGGIGCALATEQGVETHAVRDGIWVATVRSAWEVPGYEASVDSRVWPA